MAWWRSHTISKHGLEEANHKHGSLAIHMVIVPFLRYGANENTTLEREMDYKHCLTNNSGPASPHPHHKLHGYIGEVQGVHQQQQAGDR